MIIDAIVSVVVGIFTGVLGLLPSYELPDSITNLGSSVGEAVGTLNGVFPVGTLGVCIGLMIAARLFLFAFGLAVWVYEHIPFKAT